MKPLIKWPGGKETEIKYLSLPQNINNYYEPFVGGGVCFFALTANRYFLNDKCAELIAFYKLIQEQNQEFFAEVKAMGDEWRRIEDVVRESDGVPAFTYPDWTKRIQRKLKKSNPIPKEHLEAAAKGAYYNILRQKYNETGNIACFYFLRAFCYSSMFRFNPAGQFNSAYGGITYNSRRPDDRLDYWRSAELVSHLQAAEFSCLDFADFIANHQYGPDDFMFLDPPYDGLFSTYNKNVFTEMDQRRLATLLETCPCRWMLLVKSTPLMSELYGKFNIEAFEKRYRLNFKNRNDQKVIHWLIKNY